MDGGTRRLEAHRPFFALLPPPDVVLAIAAMRDTLDGLRSRVAGDRLHITLLILDDLPELTPGLANRLRAVGDGVVADAPEIVLDRLACGSANAVLLPSGEQPGLRALQGAMTRGLAAAGLPPREGFRFGPHLTLGYRPREQGTRAIAPIRWRADEFVLIDSWVGLTRHERLGAWPLHQPRTLF